jgi:hypothetical protein
MKQEKNWFTPQLQFIQLIITSSKYNLGKKVSMAQNF